MEYEDDEKKSQATLRERGFDFEFAARVFDGEVIDGGSSRLDGRTGENEMPTVTRSRRPPMRTGRVDWNRVHATTDKEIARQIANDPDTAPEVTEEALDRSIVVGTDGTRTPYRHRVGERHSLECLAPGTKAPESGLYEIIGPRGGRTGEVRTVVKGEPLPPTPASGQRYRPMGSSRRRRGA